MMLGPINIVPMLRKTSTSALVIHDHVCARPLQLAPAEPLARCRGTHSPALQDAEIAHINDDIARFHTDRAHSSSAAHRTLSSNESLRQDPLMRCRPLTLFARSRLALSTAHVSPPPLTFHSCAACHQRSILLNEALKSTSWTDHLSSAPTRHSTVSSAAPSWQTSLPPRAPT